MCNLRRALQAQPGTTRRLLVDFQAHMLPMVQTSLGTPGVDFPTLNPATVKTRVKYGLSAVALTTETVPFTEVHPSRTVLSAST